MKNKPELIRTFLAFDIDADLRNSMTEIMEFFKTHNLPIKWSKPENLHVTLRFYGEIPAELISQLEQEISKLVASLQTFSLTNSGVRLFPPSSRPICVALLFTLSEDLAKLVSSLEQAAEKCGFVREDRPFVPHLTLGRFKVRQKLDVNLNHPIKIPNILSVNDIILYRSDFVEDGTIYTPLKKWHLKKA